MVNNLRSFGTAKEIWDYLKRIYYQDNSARQFQLELKISNFSQSNLSIKQYYSGFINLWSNIHSGIIYSKVPKEALVALQAVHEVSRHDQFLMKLRPEFEVARAGLLNRNPVPSLDICLGELLRKEQRMATQAVIGASKETSEVVNIAYAAQGRNRGKGQMQCYSCKLFGHIARNCGKKFWNYYPNIIGPTSTSINQPVITLEMVQQMIFTAFSALRLQGQGKTFFSLITNGSNLPITTIGDIGPFFVMYLSFLGCLRV
ncbi:unnamed protein product [Musa textilis]